MAGVSKSTINLEEVEDGGGAKPRVPEGGCRVRIELGVKFATSQSGNPMFAVGRQGHRGQAARGRS